MLTKSITIALAGAMLSTAGIASAAERDTRSTTVEYADLDLSTQEGRDELDQRIDRAAKGVCGMGERSTGSNMVSRDSRECYRDAKRQLADQFAEITRNAQRGG